MSVTTENAPVQGQTTLQENRAGEGVYASLFEKINLAPASRLGDINDFLDDAALSEAPAAERLTAAMQVFMERIRQSGQRVEKLDKTLIDHHIAELDFQISRQLDAVMHHQEFQQVESLWRGLKQLVDNTDYPTLTSRRLNCHYSTPRAPLYWCVATCWMRCFREALYVKQPRDGGYGSATSAG
ncbi:EvpB/family type VI secretion protein [Klebsiella variicola]|nr:EvpB/family type VI secretion protein [Klebsiella variicola]